MSHGEPVNRARIGHGRPRTASMSRTDYRPDIDGLRALAVLAVIVFHIEPAWLPGGYIGVDIFFVISGFLISDRIRLERERTGTFSFANFYVRRLRRLFPALFFTVVATVGAVLLLFPPGAARSALLEGSFSLVGLSNFLFWTQAGYFDAESITKPLLHTWSLGVEEQFYLFWPLLLMLAWRGAKPSRYRLWIAAAALASFVANAAMTWWGDLSGLFYLMPFRIFEFAIGAALVGLPRRPGVERPALAVGLAAIALSLALYDEQTLFPYYAALLPCLGAALTLYGGRAAGLGAVLSNPVSVWIGRVSYSAYLVHWPVVVFFAARMGRNANVWEALPMLAAMLAAASLMYRYVELPFRVGIPARRRGGFAVACAGAVGVYIAASVSVSAALRADMAFDFDAVQKEGGNYTWTNIYKMRGDWTAQARRKILLIGDSQGADVLNLLLARDPSLAPDIVTFVSSKFCQIKSDPAFYSSGAYKDRFKPLPDQVANCQKEIAAYDADRRIEAADIIILSYAWYASVEIYLPKDLAALRLRNPKARILIGGRKDQPDTSIAYMKNGMATEIAAIAAAASPDEDVAAANRALQAIAGPDFLDMYGLLCRDGVCTMLTDTGYPILFDYRHFTPAGALFIARSPAFQNLIGDKLGLPAN